MATGKGTPVMLRLQPGLLGKLDDHIADQAEPKPTRPEAIRRLLEQSLIC